MWSNKRCRSGDWQQCQECKEQFDTKDDINYGVCGECQMLMCGHCYSQALPCGVCKVECQGFSLVCCVQCTETCDACGGEVWFHPFYKADHLASCNARSRAERAAASAAQKVADKETSLKENKEALVRIQQRIAALENGLKCAKEEKEKADKKLAEASSSGPESKAETGAEAGVKAAMPASAAGNFVDLTDSMD